MAFSTASPPAPAPITQIRLTEVVSLSGVVCERSDIVWGVSYRITLILASSSPSRSILEYLNGKRSGQEMISSRHSKAWIGGESQIPGQH